MGKASSAGWNGGGTGLWLCPCPAPSLAEECWAVLLPQLLLTGRRRSGSSVHPACQYSANQVPPRGTGKGIYSCKAAGWEGEFWPEWVLEFGHLSSGVVLLWSAVLWIWHWAPFSQGHRRLMVLLTVLLMPDDAKGNCQDFASCFLRNGAINDEECCSYCKFRLMLIRQLSSQGSLHASCSCKYSLFHEVAIDHTELM